MSIDFPELAAIRLGYGLSPNQPPPPDLAAVMHSVQRATTIKDAPTTADFRKEFERWQKVRRSQRGAGFDTAAQRIRQNFSLEPERDLARRLLRAASEPVGFGERLVQFWSDHFTVRSKSLTYSMLASAFVDEAIRPHLSGKFENMLLAAASHPGMLMYLDQSGSVGPNSVRAQRMKGRRTFGLNENLARELIELHTLGVQAEYGQADITELAELLTGLTFEPRNNRNYRPDFAEPGAEQVLGTTYGGRGTDGMGEIRRALADLATHPNTAEHLARKLVVHFLTDSPTPEAVDYIAAVWRDTGGDLGAINESLAQHPDLVATFRQKARQPFDFMAAAFRALAVDTAQLPAMEIRVLRRDIAFPMIRMGQSWQRPVGPDGWAEAASNWVTPQGLAARIDWSLRTPARLLNTLPDPRDFVTAALGNTASDPLRNAVPRAESVDEGVALVLASADFNRR